MNRVFSQATLPSWSASLRSSLQTYPEDSLGPFIDQSLNVPFVELFPAHIFAGRLPLSHKPDKAVPHGDDSEGGP